MLTEGDAYKGILNSEYWYTKPVKVKSQTRNLCVQITECQISQIHPLPRRYEQSRSTQVTGEGDGIMWRREEEKHFVVVGYHFRINASGAA